MPDLRHPQLRDGHGLPQVWIADARLDPTARRSRRRGPGRPNATVRWKPAPGGTLRWSGWRSQLGRSASERDRIDPAPGDPETHRPPAGRPEEGPQEAVGRRP